MQEIFQILENIKKSDNFRNFEYQNQEAIDFISNDYLNLRFDRENLNCGIEYAKKFGNSLSSSRLLGNNEVYFELENTLAAMHKKEKCIIFPSGFQANSTIIPALLQAFSKENVAIFADKLNHSSIQCGFQLANVYQYRYRNNDLNHLEDLLKKHGKKSNFVITEGVFSMDGSVLNIHDLKTLKDKYNFYLYVDDAHGFGIFGKNGSGVCEELSDVVDFSIGTLSKSAASQGGYICCSEAFYQYFLNKTSGIMYSTGLNPFSVGVALSSIKKIPKMHEERKHILDLSHYAINKLKTYSFNTLHSNSQIIPIVINNIKMQKQQIRNFFAERNISVAVIKHPTVPLNLERIRISINKMHTRFEVDSFIDALTEITKTAN
jgi:8-amino-7-oxononanoate synthase